MDHSPPSMAEWVRLQILIGKRTTSCLAWLCVTHPIARRVLVQIKE
jgi:hypothetical protein